MVRRCGITLTGQIKERQKQDPATHAQLDVLKVQHCHAKPATIALCTPRMPTTASHRGSDTELEGQGRSYIPKVQNLPHGLTRNRNSWTGWGPTSIVQ